jgi:predicted alpha/beta superfamily hydrolase
MDKEYFGDINAKLVLIQPVDEHDLSFIDNEIKEIKRLTNDKEFLLIAFKANDWNKDLSPYKAPAVFGKDDFGNGASNTLKEILDMCNDLNKAYVIGGYSLAGLFAIWAACNTHLFKGVVGASPSLWFPNFINYMKENNINTDHVYLSLGDKEEKTKNPVMSKVGICIKDAYEILKNNNIDVTFEWNEGNHFKDADIRTAKGFAWVINKLSK